MQEFVFQRPVTGIIIGVIGAGISATALVANDDPIYHAALLIAGAGSAAYIATGITGLFGNIRENRHYNDPTF